MYPAIGEILYTLFYCLQTSIGIKEGLVFAETEINYLLEKYESFLLNIEEIDKQVIQMCRNLEETKKIMEIKGIGIVTASGIVAELGDIRKYKNSKQIIKMAGLSLIENSSGNMKGKTTISRKRPKRFTPNFVSSDIRNDTIKCFIQRNVYLLYIEKQESTHWETSNNCIM